MTQRPTIAAIVAVLLLGGVPLLAQEPDPHPHPGLAEGETHVQGLVTDRATGQTMSGVSVVMRAVDGSASAMRLTDGDGTFHFQAVRSGEYELEFRHIGYRDVDVALETGDGSYTDVRLEMVPQAVELEPVIVTSARRDRLSRSGFYDRRRSASGNFLTRDDIQRRPIARVSQLFRGIAGFTVVPTSGGFDHMVVGRGNCHPSLYVDGVLMRTASGSQIDQVLEPDHLEGLEVYSASQTPGRFLAGRCGTIVAWTHTPSSGVDGHPFEWRRMGVAAGLVVAVFTVFF